MPSIVTIAGSPSAHSRTLGVAHYAGQWLRARGFEVHSINVRDLPAEDLLTAKTTGAIGDAVALLEGASGVVVATPVYKAAYAGALKVFLDLLSQSALAGKVVLPLATGGTVAHLLAIDYALRPVLNALGAQHILNGLFITDKQVQKTDANGFVIDDAILERLHGSLTDLVVCLSAVATPPTSPLPTHR